MDHKQAKDAAGERDCATKGTDKRARGKFDKPLGSSHDDDADLRDVAEEAAKKSQ